MTAAVVLAAGAARRYGRQKLLAPLAGRPVVRWVVECALASGVDSVVVVLGREGERVRGALEGLPVRFAPNPDYARGMSTTLRAGIRALPDEALAAVILLGDQPTVAPDAVRALLDAWRRTPFPIVLPSYGGAPGHPVLFDAVLFPELLMVRGDQGGREVVARDPARVLRVELPFSPPPDIDTPADRDALERRLARGVHASDSPGDEPENRGKGSTWN